MFLLSTGNLVNVGKKEPRFFVGQMTFKVTARMTSAETNTSVPFRAFISVLARPFYFAVVHTLGLLLQLRLVVNFVRIYLCLR